MKIRNVLKWGLAACLCAVGVLSLQAQNITKPKIACPNGLWVNSYNGVLFFTRIDAEMKNTVLPISLQFYYNSSYKDRNYGYGLGFSMGEEMRYALSLSGDSVTIERGDGRSDLYLKKDQGYEAPTGVFDRLTQQGEGQFVLTMKDGTIYRFENAKHKRVTKIENRSGLVTTLQYQPDGLLTGVSDNAGRSLALTYTYGLLTKATGSFIQGEISYQYDSRKRLTKVTDPMGYTRFYGYDKQDQLTSVTDPMGNVTEIGYTQQGAVYRVKTAVSDKVIRYEVANKQTVIVDYTEPAAQFSYYVWDDKGRVIEKSGLCCGIQEKLVYDEDDNVTQRTDANGNIRTYTYDSNGNMLTATDPEGHTETYTYELAFNQVASYRDKNGNDYSFSYDDSGNLTEISGPEGFTNRYTYNAMGAPLTITDANGNVTQNEYDHRGLQISQTDAMGNIRKFAYDGSGNLISSTDARLFVTRYTYNRRNELVQLTDALGGVLELSYDRNGNVVRIKDAKGRITANTYDALGNVLSTIDPAGRTVTYRYNGKSMPIEIKDEAGNITKYAYDEHDRVIRMVNAENEATSYAYDMKGNLQSVVLPNGNTLTYSYSKNDLVIETADALGTISTQTYDANGNVLTQTDGEGRTITYRYDGLNRLVSSMNPSGNSDSYVYDKNSNRLSYTNRNGDTESYEYDALNRLKVVTDALFQKTRFEYDSEGNLVTAIDAKNNRTGYTYDALGQNTHITFANNTTQEYTYDLVGNVIQLKKRDGAKIKFTYDVLDQLVEKLYPDGTTDRYGYDPLGQMVSAVNRGSTVTLAYDKIGRILSETLNGQSITYAYDVPNHTRSLVYPNGKKVIQALDTRNQIVEIRENGTVVVNQTYNKAGQMTSRKYNNGITTAYEYNANGWLSKIADGKILDLLMSYDKVGNMLSRLDQLHPERSEVYGYDKIQQLTSFKRGKEQGGAVTLPTRMQTFRYDALGNRISVEEDGKTTNYAVNNVNEYTEIRGELTFTPQYDANGNMVKDEAHTYRYDYNNKLVQVDENTATYTYDALGRRISKKTAEGTVNFFYAGDDVIEEQDGSKALLATYLIGNGIDDMIKMNRKGNDYFYHTNHLGSVMAVSDRSGTVQERYEYDPFGKVSFYNGVGTQLTKSAIGNEVLFTGRSYNAESGLYDYRARTMKPNIGRFVQVDPLLYVDGMNTLEYVNNNSIGSIDPMGLFSTKDFINMFGFDVCKTPENECANEKLPLKEVMDNFNDVLGNFNDVLGFLQDLGMKTYWGKNAKNKFSPFRKGKNTMKFFDVKFSFSNRPSPGAGYKRFDDFGKKFESAGLFFTGLDLLNKGLTNSLSWCDAADLTLGLVAGRSSHVGALTFGWDIGTIIRGIPAGRGRNVGNYIDAALMPIFDPYTSAFWELRYNGPSWNLVNQMINLPVSPEQMIFRAANGLIDYAVSNN